MVLETRSWGFGRGNGRVRYRDDTWVDEVRLLGVTIGPKEGDEVETRGEGRRDSETRFVQILSNPRGVE